jgi:hypothetical protein
MLLKVVDRVESPKSCHGVEVVRDDLWHRLGSAIADLETDQCFRVAGDSVWAPRADVVVLDVDVGLTRNALVVSWGRFGVEADLAPRALGEPGLATALDLVEGHHAGSRTAPCR